VTRRNASTCPSTRDGPLRGTAQTHRFPIGNHRLSNAHDSHHNGWSAPYWPTKPRFIPSLPQQHLFIAMVQSSPQIQRKPTVNVGGNELYPEHSAHWTNQHRDALRLALGSILAPKRPSASRSSSSGTASPAPPHTPPVVDHLLHPHYVPSKLSLSTSESTARDFPSATPLPYTPLSPDHSALPSPFPLSRTSSHKGPAAELHVTSGAPQIQSSSSSSSSTEGAGASGGSGSGTPKAKFIETLQGKSAWDALIHGSFS